MKRLGITLRHEISGQHYEWRDNLDTRWYFFFKKIGILPILLPNDLELSQSLIQSIFLDGFILTGGPDHKSRCELENFLIKHAIEKQLPLLGVCHGMQMIQRYFGESLIKVKNHVKPQQSILWKNKVRMVNSYHTLGTTQSHIDLKVLAYFPEDRVIKAIQHKIYKLMGIMWHPERNPCIDEEDFNLFKEFFNL